MADKLVCKTEEEVLQALRDKREFTLSTTLTILNLDTKDIGDSGAKSLSDSLKVNTTLTFLNLENNNIGESGAKSLSDSLKVNTTLTVLDLGGNNIGESGAKSLSDSLKVNTTLTVLALGGNNIGDEGAKALLEAMKLNYSITNQHDNNNWIEEFIKDNKCSADLQQSLEDELSKNTDNIKSATKKQAILQMREAHRRAEEARIAEEHRRAEEARIAEEHRRAEEARIAEEHRRAEDARKTEMRKVIEQKNPTQDKWTYEHTVLFISSLKGFEKYAQKFLDEKVTGEDLVSLQESDLNGRFNMSQSDGQEFFNVILSQWRSKQFVLLLEFQSSKIKLNAKLSFTDLKNEISSKCQIPVNKLIIQVFDEEFEVFVDVNSVDKIPEKGKITIMQQSQIYVGQVTSIKSPLSPNQILKDSEKVSPPIQTPSPTKPEEEIPHSLPLAPFSTQSVSTLPAEMSSQACTPDPAKFTSFQSSTDFKVFEPTKRKALIITMAKYFKVFDQLSAPPTDGQEISNFLSSHCEFQKSDIAMIEDEASKEKIELEFTKLDNEAKIIGNEKLLVFVYYSGHGTINSSGSTNGHTLDGEPFNIESSVRKLATRPNIAVISILDCCRVEQKGFTKVSKKVGGQLCLIHATQPGKTAIGGSVGKCSAVTAQFLELMKNSSQTFPLSIQNWAKSHNYVQVTDRMPFEIPLKSGSGITSQIPFLITMWTPENLIAWLKSIGVRRIDTYVEEISQNGYDGKWILRRKDNIQELSELFTLKADVGDVRFELGSWMKNHPQ